MPDYKGIPFDGGLDSPSGTGAQSIVATLKAIIDFFNALTSPGTLLDASNAASVQFDARTLNNSAGQVAVDYELLQLIEPTTATLRVDWAACILHDLSATVSVDWQNRQLIDQMSGVRLQWSTSGVALPGLSGTDPGVPGVLWNNAGFVAISP